MPKKPHMPKNADQLTQLAEQHDLNVRRGNGKVVLSANNGSRAFVVSDHPREFDMQTKSRLKKWLLSIGIPVGILLFIIIRSWFGFQA